MSGLDYERLVLSAGPLGLMQSCMDVAVPYAKERKQFGKPIGEFQFIQGKLADMYATTAATRQGVIFSDVPNSSTYMLNVILYSSFTSVK